jgi:hypothetical protein
LNHCAGVALDLNAVREGSPGAHTLKLWRPTARVSRGVIPAALRRLGIDQDGFAA